MSEVRHPMDLTPASVRSSRRARIRRGRSALVAMSSVVGSVATAVLARADASRFSPGDGGTNQAMRREAEVREAEALAAEAGAAALERRASLAERQRETLDWSGPLFFVAGASPRDVAVARMGMELITRGAAQSPQSLEFRISGTAGSRESLAVLVQRLEGPPIRAQVELDRVAVNADGSVGFGLRAAVAIEGRGEGP